eukprot:TRINITY_DN10928_c0_g1_i10.p1 TRINITY_DN10928_c0_g1~~TRINITY_DN10928_c0_g1_i10.p1  ORF type:complete len:300 (+),score=55.70 TRINITY_DN10928_c0_g1_i10:427-1326(+)
MVDEPSHTSCKMSNLTVRETLHYAALLKLPKSYPDREAKLARAEAVLDELGLRKSADTIVGNELQKGISGGEKKRLNVGVELLAEPSAIILDEPTSGLDSATALSLMRLMKELTMQQNRIIIASLHQPSSETFELIDTVLLMSEGRLAYFGAAAHALAHFEAIGLRCKTHYNPADFFWHVLTHQDQRDHALQAWSVRSEGPAAELHRTKRSLIDVDVAIQLRPQLPSHAHSEPQAIQREHFPISWMKQAEILTERSFKQSRSVFWSPFIMFQSIFISVIVNIIWFQIPEKESLIQDRIG